jgi:hypothetical protein
MANTLESIMRLNDEYTATMKKIISAADEYDKKQQEAIKATNSFQLSLKNLSANSSSVASGISAIALKIGGIVTASMLAKKAVTGLFDAIQNGAKQQVQLNTLKSLMGNSVLGTDLYNYVSAYALESALGRSDLASAVTSFLAYTKDAHQIQQLLKLVERLYMWNPEQGGEGAVFALKEVLGGQTTSLKNRFNINGISAEKVTDFYNQGDTEGLINYLDEMLNKAGATQDVVEANFKSLTVQAQNFVTNFADAMGSQANPAVQQLTETLIELNSQLKAGDFDGFFNAMASAVNNLAIAGAWLAKHWQVVIPTISAVIGAFTAYKIASEAIQLVTLTTGITIDAVTGNWIGLGAAILGAASAGILASKILGSTGSEASEQLQSAEEAMKKLQEDQQYYGASTNGNAINANITNEDPIKVTGSVEIETENLKYVFEAASAKFYAQFNATKVVPSVIIENQNVTQTADLDEIDRYLGNLVAERAAVSPGGRY